MSGEAITVALLTIASVIAATIMISAVYPSINDVSGAFSSSTRTASERIQTDVKIINILNATDAVNVWVKNTGSKKIASSLIEKTDVFFGATGNFQFIPYNAGWNYTIVNGDGDNDWDPSETLHISINSTTPKGEYYVGIVLYNSIAVSDYFST